MAGFLSPFTAGHTLSAADLQTISDEIGGLVALKAGDQTIASSATLTNDTQLFVPVVANGVYEVRAIIMYRAAATPQIKIGWTGPAGSALDWNPDSMDGSVTTTFSGIANRAAYTIGLAPTLGVSGTSQTVVAEAIGTLTVAGTAGNFRLQWAQAVSNATGTVVKAGSRLSLTRCG